MEILTDAAFTSVEITDRLIFRDETFIDSERNINAKTVHCDFLSCRNIHIEDAVVNDPETFLNLGSSNNRSVVIEPMLKKDDFNEPLGDHAACVGGRYNEALGADSVTIGGQENQASGDSSIAMGRSAFAKHDNTLVFNTVGEQPVESTAARQCVFASDGGMLFKLPKSHDIQTHMVPEGYACWCWDPVAKQVIMKTKQDNVFYKTFLEETKVNEVGVSLETEGDTVRLNVNNPDHS